MITNLIDQAERQVRAAVRGTGNYYAAVEALRSLDRWLDEGAPGDPEEDTYAQERLDELRDELERGPS